MDFAGAGWHARRITVVENAVDLSRFDPAAVPRTASRSALGVGDGLVLSVIAQITPWKGQDLAIRTVAELRSRGHHALLLIVGEAKFLGAATRHDNRAFEQKLHALARTFQLDDRVRFLGERPDPEHILAATDVLLVPSTEEPFGRTIIEAMAMGVPVAATNVGGPAEILSDEIGGCVVAGRDPAAWADAVEAMSSRSPTQHAAARARAEARFSREHHVAAMLSVYTEALAHAAR
jgi:glycosyltransferase involved in cell wall biosynthesis